MMILLAALLGMVFAVVINGLADNLLREDSVPWRAAAIPRCGYCDATRKFQDWSAVVSTLVFSGKCRRCGAPRPLRDLLVEAVLWIGLPLVWLLGYTDPHAFLAGAAIFSTCILFSVIDIEHRYVVVEAVALVSLALILNGWTYGIRGLLTVLEGGLVGFAVFFLLFLLGKGLALIFRLGLDVDPLGFGDVILATLVGCITGWPAILLAMFVSIFLGGIFGLVFLFIRLVQRSALENATMAYGPYLLAAGLIVYFLGTPFLGGIINLLQAF